MARKASKPSRLRKNIVLTPEANELLGRLVSRWSYGSETAVFCEAIKRLWQLETERLLLPLDLERGVVDRLRQMASSRHRTPGDLVAQWIRRRMAAADLQVSSQADDLQKKLPFFESDI